jgi:hypothetical protein
MTYRVTGLDPAPFKPLFNLSDDELAEQGIVRMTVNSPTFPCRVSLTDRAIGETVLLLNHVSHDVDNPYRAAHAIFVAENEEDAADYVDQVPPVFEKRILSLRAFDQSGMMVDAALAQPGEADTVIRRLLENQEVDHIDAHNATRGCFSARVERS